jgi:hypothetical protein
MAAGQVEGRVGPVVERPTMGATDPGPPGCEYIVSAYETSDLSVPRCRLLIPCPSPKLGRNSLVVRVLCIRELHHVHVVFVNAN